MKYYSHGIVVEDEEEGMKISFIFSMMFHKVSFFILFGMQEASIYHVLMM